LYVTIKSEKPDTRMILNPTLHIDSGARERRTLRHRALIGALLVLSLLLVQWVGYAHAIAHWHGQGSVAAHLQNAERIVDAGNGLFDHQKASGACVALDAATLGAGPCSSSFALPALHAPQLPPVTLPEPRWRPAFSALFSTRAPPLNA
jgi:hypothetical protein